MAEDITGEVIALMVRELKIDPSQVEENTALFEGGLELDSFAIVELITHVEAHFGIQFSDEDFRPENFETVGALANVVARYQSA